MAEWDTTALISDVVERGSLPANDLRFSDAKILAAATLELREGIAPMLVASRAEYLVYPYNVSVVSGTAEYRMPPRAVGGALRDVGWTGLDGQPNSLRQLSQDEAALIGNSANQGTPYGYYVRNYHVRLVPVPNVSGTLSMPYYARPNKLVLPSSAVAITEAAQNGTTWTLTIEDPPAPLQYVGEVTIDVVRATPGFESLVASGVALVTSPGPGLYYFVVECDGEIASGDYVCLPGEAPVAQAPVEMHGLLAARTCRRLVKATGDDRWQSLQADVIELEDKVKNWLASRVAGDTQQAGGSIGWGGMLPVGTWWGF